MSALLMARPKSADGADLPRFLSVEQLAALFTAATSVTTLYRELNAGLFPAIRIRTRWIVPSRAVVALERAVSEMRPVESTDWDFGWNDPMGNGARFFRLAQAARLFGMSEATLKRDISDGNFPAVRIRRAWVVPAKAIDSMERAALGGWTYVNASDWKLPMSVASDEAPAGSVVRP